ncbi:DoxX family protein [Nocardioides sp. CER19]|uniref:DoxX family protein n=1 Tax=Nocardioides sp. CER19 TaxID=3038538 RepID=UPI00244A0791|nr:DoxX family protein [Nocardioides sp. CER19]MDH2413823.1 DoxX family protein [Nocardioides sp. CER19]
MPRSLLPALAVLARLVTGGVWIWAGAAKLTDPYGAVLAVRAYQLLPAGLATTVGHLLPTLEIVVGAALVLGLLTRGAAVVSGLLFVAFIIGISSAWARGLQIDCGCFGGGGFDPHAASKYPWEIARDTALLLASVFLVFVRDTGPGLDRLLFRRTPAPTVNEELT